MANHYSVSRIIEILQAVGLESSTENIHGISVAVARGITSTEYDSTMKAFVTIISPFSSKRFNVYFYIAIGEVDNLSKQTLEQFMQGAYKACEEMAKVDKKQKKIRYKGKTCIPILMTGNADGETKSWVKSTTKAHYQAIEIPVIIDTNENVIYYNDRAPLKMRVFYMPGRELIESLIRKSIVSDDEI